MAARMGFPVTRTRPGRNHRAVSGKLTKTRSANFPRILFVSPGMAFCSAIAVGRPMQRAASTAGPEA